jgi:c-di-GMP-binding flagellar brake protein YcgR
MERRKEMRFPALLKVGAVRQNKDSILGLIKDFSRSGLRAVFDNFESEPNSYTNIKIQNPDEDVFFSANAEVRWKRPTEGRWEVGFRFKDFVPQAKAEILEYAYKKWLKDRASS